MAIILPKNKSILVIKYTSWLHYKVLSHILKLHLLPPMIEKDYIPFCSISKQRIYKPSINGRISTTKHLFIGIETLQ